MAFNYLTNIPIEEARLQFITSLKDQGLEARHEGVKTVESAHRITSQAVYAQISAPHYNACAMDGIALKASSTFGATETNPLSLREGTYQWVNTGDPLPDGYDCVVMVEDVIEQDGRFTLFSAATPWQNIRQIGEDISAGDMIVPSYTELTPPMLGAMLAAGVLNVDVIRRPLVGIIPTGNELVSPTGNPKEGDIIEFNSTIFTEIFRDLGCETKVYAIAKDQPDQIEERLIFALKECDVIILNAGSSAGTKDYSAEAIKRTGKVLIHGIAIKPGKPTILGYGQYEGKVIPMIGLPGYPVSGIFVLDQIVKPVISILTMQIEKPDIFMDATISRRLTSSLKYLEYVRARLGHVNEKLVAVPLNRGAGVVSSFVKADGIIHIPQNVEGYEAGEKVSVQLLRNKEQIDKTLVITGSHDPLLDEIADIMRQKWPDSQVASSHVGSMGGIMAIKRGEAHLGGVHLLDEATGEYNTAYVKKYFPSGGVVLMNCVKRTQGLIIAKDNPLKIKSIEDLPGLRYVNRQKGSGTRILIDFLTKTSNIETDKVEGYDREEFTHTAVAAAIFAGTADAGLGIYSAAKIYDLDFIPVCEEQYDLLVLENALENIQVKRLIEIIKGNEFSNRLLQMGGYKVKNPGEFRIWN